MTKKDQKRIISFIITILFLIGYLFFSSTNFDTSYSSKNSINQNIVSTDLSIYYIDVGQADSILISNNNHHMLIDAGNNEDGPKLVNFLKNELNISKLDYVIGTHPHEDHIGGLDDIINNFEIENVYLPDVITTTKTFEEVLEEIENKSLSITVPKIGGTIALGEADFTILHTGTDTKDLNHASIVLKMIFGDYSYLFTGDATAEIEKNIINDNIDIDVLKVAHHGSLYSTTEEFLSKVTPTYAIISVGKDNTYNHPSKETIDRLKQYTNNIYITSELGTILLTSNGKEIKIDNFKTDTNG